MSKNDKKFDFKSEITYLTVVILSWRSVIKFFQMTSQIPLKIKEDFKTLLKSNNWNNSVTLNLSFTDSRWEIGIYY